MVGFPVRLLRLVIRLVWCSSTVRGRPHSLLHAQLRLVLRRPTVLPGGWRRAALLLLVQRGPLVGGGWRLLLPLLLQWGGRLLVGMEVLRRGTVLLHRRPIWVPLLRLHWLRLRRTILLHCWPARVPLLRLHWLRLLVQYVGWLHWLLLLVLQHVGWLHWLLLLVLRPALLHPLGLALLLHFLLPALLHCVLLLCLLRACRRRLLLIQQRAAHKGCLWLHHLQPQDHDDPAQQRGGGTGRSEGQGGRLRPGRHRVGTPHSPASAWLCLHSRGHSRPHPPQLPSRACPLPTSCP